MKRFFKKIQNIYWLVIVTVTMSLYETSAWADASGSGIGSRAESIVKELVKVKSLVLVAGIIAGVIMIFRGGLALAKGDRGGEGGAGKAGILIIAGIILAGIPSIILIFGYTAYNEKLDLEIK